MDGSQGSKPVERYVPATLRSEIEDDETPDEWENTSEVTTDEETAAARCFLLLCLVVRVQAW